MQNHLMKGSQNTNLTFKTNNKLLTVVKQHVIAYILCSKCFPSAWTHALTGTRHWSITWSMTRLQSDAVSD